MRTFSSDLSGMLRSGIRPGRESALNSTYMSTITDFRVTPYGLAGLRSSTQINYSSYWRDSLDTQVFAQKSDNLLVYGQDPSDSDRWKLFTRTEDGTVAIVSVLDSISLTPVFELALPLADYVDFGNSWFLISPEDMVLKIPSRATPLRSTYFKANSACRWGDRLVLGGLNAPILAADTELTRQIIELMGPESNAYAGDVIGDSWLMWTSPVGQNLSRPFEPELAMLGAVYISTTQTNLNKDKTEGNALLYDRKMGFMKIPSGRPITAVRPLGDDLVVATDSELYLISSSGGIKSWNPSGCARGALAGDMSELLLVDRYGNFFRLEPGFKTTALDYSQLSMAGAKICFDPEHREYYLTKSGSSGLLLTNFGLSSLTCGVYSLANKWGMTFQVRNAISGFSTSSFTTGWNTLGNPSQKTLREIAVTSISVTDLEWAAASEFGSTGWLPMHESGNANLSLVGTRFVAGFRCSTVESSVVTNIKLSYQQSDKRFIRGSYATQVGTDSGQ